MSIATFPDTSEMIKINNPDCSLWGWGAGHAMSDNELLSECFHYHNAGPTTIPSQTEATHGFALVDFADKPADFCLEGGDEIMETQFPPGTLSKVDRDDFGHTPMVRTGDRVVVVLKYSEGDGTRHSGWSQDM